MLVSKYIYRQEGTYGQHHRHSYISCHIRSSRKKRYYSKKVAQEDEKEHCQQIRCISAIILLPYGCFYQVVIDHHYHHLHQSGQAFRRALLHRIMAPVPSCRAKHQYYQQQSRKHKRSHVLSDRYIKWTDQFTIRSGFHNLTLISSFLGQIKPIIFMSMLNLRGHKCIPPTLPAINNTRQWNRYMLSLPIGYMPSVRITDMSEKHLSDVNLLGRRFFACTQDDIAGLTDNLKTDSQHQ